MNWRAISAMVRKDVTVALRSKAVTMPLVIIPLLLLVGLPIALGTMVAFAERIGLSSTDIKQINTAIPPALRGNFTNLTNVRAGLIFALVYLFAPMYLIMPLMVSSVVAADSFAGEKERGTLEALVYTPTTDTELLLAKMLGGWVPGALVGIFGFFIYIVVVDTVTWQLMQMLILPNGFWLLLALWVGPAAAGLGLGVTVLVSSRVNTFQEAYQVSSLVVLPVVFLTIGQLAGFFYLSMPFVFAVGLVLWGIDAILFYVGAVTFKRSELIARLA